MKGQRGFVHLTSIPADERVQPNLFARLLGQLWRWHELGRQRRTLAALSDGALKDLGLSRADIQEESDRPFWDDPLKK